MLLPDWSVQALHSQKSKTKYIVLRTYCFRSHLKLLVSSCWAVCFDKKARKARKQEKSSKVLDEVHVALLPFQGGWSGILTKDLTVNPKPRSSYLRSYEVGSFARSAHGSKHGHQDARQHQLRENQCSIQEELSGSGFEDTRNALVYEGKCTGKYQNHQTIFLPGTRPCRILYAFRTAGPPIRHAPGRFCSL